MAGCPGLGKSTISSRLTVRFGITQVVTTDTLREVFRTVIARVIIGGELSPPSPRMRRFLLHK